MADPCPDRTVLLRNGKTPVLTMPAFQAPVGYGKFFTKKLETGKKISKKIW
jgi:hypothetical protein